jgi:hypothetical protein
VLQIEIPCEGCLASSRPASRFFTALYTSVLLPKFPKFLSPAPVPAIDPPRDSRRNAVGYVRTQVS